MSPFFHTILPILPVLFLSFLITIPKTNGQSLIINETCRASAHDDPNISYNFCTTSLQAAPASRCASLQGLGMISIRLVRYNVTDTRCYIKHLLKNKKWNPYSKQCLKDCFDMFSDAIDTVKQAMKYYNSKQYNDANVQISSVMDAATTCEDGFKERKGLISPLTKRNQNTFQISAVALSIMKTIQKGSDI